MKRALPLVLILLLAAGISCANGAAQKEKAGGEEPATSLKDLDREFGEAFARLRKDFEAAQDQAARAKIRDQAMEMMGKFANRALDFAEKNPKHAEAADAIIWGLQRARDEATRDRAVLLLTKDHVNHKNIGRICTMIAELPNPVVEKLLRTVAEKNPDRTAQGLATLALAKHLESRAEDARGEEAEKLAKEAEKVLKTALDKYADVETDEGTVGQQAKAALSLAIGREVPEIVGKDSQDQEFKLSDYRGKVVMLDFWASWCGPCMAMVPHNRELVKKMEKRPFALVGVNADQDKNAFLKAEKDHSINYRSFYDGEGKIVESWRVRAFPTMMIIDHKGIMRHKFVGGGPANMKAIDAAIEALVKEAEAEANNGK
jgi:thiol-disulfide isomerase/thioredoxin